MDSLLLTREKHNHSRMNEKTKKRKEVASSAAILFILTYYKRIYLFYAAPPTFIKPLEPYHGVLTTAKEVSMSCQVECYPLCDIIWLKDGLPLGDTAEFYTIKKRTLPPDVPKSDFESVASTLTWNLSGWPGGQLDRVHDNANYTCQSTGNTVGSGVSSTTSFRVECNVKCSVISPLHFVSISLSLI